MNLADKLTVEQWPIDRLIEYARNPRKNDAVVDQMAGAIREFGFRIPIVAAPGSYRLVVAFWQAQIGHRQLATATTGDALEVIRPDPSST